LGDIIGFVAFKELKFALLWKGLVVIEDWKKKKQNLKFIQTWRGIITKKYNPKMMQVHMTNTNVWVWIVDRNIHVLAQHTYTLHKTQVTQHSKNLGFEKHVEHP
jgi:hypothetical protein